jgi:hypothetical protein
MKWIKYIWENGFLFRSTPKYKKYNKMCRIAGDHGVDAANVDGDDAKNLLDPSSAEDWRSSANSPSRSLLEVRFLRFLVSTNVRYLFCLHKVKLFEKTCTGGWYDRAVRAGSAHTNGRQTP